MDGYYEAYPSTVLTVAGRFDPRASGLEAGDSILTINGVKPNQFNPRLGTIIAALTAKPGPAVYEIERAGSPQTVTIERYRLRPSAVFLSTGVNFFLGLFFIVTACILHLRVRPLSRSGTASYPICKAATIVCCALVIDGGNIIAFTRVSTGIDSPALRAAGTPLIITYGLMFALLLHFFLIFPPRENAMTRSLWAPLTLHASHLALSIPALLLTLFGSGEPLLIFRPRLFLGGVYALLMIVVAFRSYKRASSPVVRNQMRWMAWGVSLGVFPWILLFLTFSIAGLHPLVDIRLTISFAAAIPLSILIAISRYKLLEIDGIIRHSLVYTVLMAGLTGTYVIAVALGTWLLRGTSGSLNSAASAAILVCLLVFAFRPIKALSERLVTRAFYRNVTDPAETRANLSEAISQVFKLPEIGHLLVNLAARSFGSTGAALMVFDESGGSKIFADSDEMRDFLDSESAALRNCLQSRPDMWSRMIYPAIERETEESIQLPEKIAVCFPMPAGNRLVGAYLLAGKLSNWLYTREELDTLRSLTHQASIGIINAFAYERLNDLNAELESLVKLRTSQLLETNSMLESRNGELVVQNTELERLLKELKETQAALLKAERKAAVGEIVIAVCHEINNPLTALMAQTELIDLQKGPTPDHIMERVRIIEQCADKIRITTERLRSLDNPTSVDYVAGIRMIDLGPMEKQSSAETTVETESAPVENLTKSSGGH